MRPCVHGVTESRRLASTRARISCTQPRSHRPDVDVRGLRPGLLACTAVHPALSIVGLLPTPALRSAALLALLRCEVHLRSGKEHTVTVTVCLPATEVISIDAMASPPNRLRPAAG
jgi:hypothetical protein